jgi:hypothetical protein
MQTWTTKDGDVLKIKDMETSHIQNCINLLKRNMPEHKYDEIIEPPDDFSCRCVIIQGRQSYQKKIKEFQRELIKRNIM